MKATTSHRAFNLAIAAALGVALSTPSLAAGVKIDELIVGTSVRRGHEIPTVKAAREFYEFWNSGDDALLKQAISPSFTDRTLPPGRPQGPQRPAFASHQFRAAVPDLRVEVKKMIVAGDYITVHMVFTGHFTGVLGHVQGKGQSITFIATDLLKVTEGRITDNWHIEDNLSLMKQLGVVPQ
jgi:predicted ester cyclase